MLDIKLVVTSSGKVMDIGTICEQLQLNWVLEGNAGYMETSYIPKQTVDLVEGDVVALQVNGRKVFYGWVFRKEVSSDKTTKVKIYDIKRYLAYKDVDVTGNETIDQFFTRICTVMKIKHRVVHTSSFILPSKIHDGETYNNMMQYAIDQTFIGTDGEQRFCIRANDDTLELVDCLQQTTDVVIGDKILLTSYDYSTDIENTYTTFKIQREISSEEQKKKNISKADEILLRKTITEKNQENVNKWGDLQYYEKKDSKYTDVQLDEYMKHVMNAYGKQTKSLKLSCLGNFDCIPGNMIILNISDLQTEKVANMVYALITDATHTIKHNIHTMELTVEIKEV